MIQNSMVRRLRAAALAAVLVATTAVAASDPTLRPETPASSAAVDIVDLGSLLDLGDLIQQFSREFVNPTLGTISYEGYLAHGGYGRRYVAIRPLIATPDAPVLVLLHPREETPERMANITAAGRLAALHGAWVLLPEAVNGYWNDSPRPNEVDDVGFLIALLDAVVPTHHLDASRVYVAGYSNGGYMAQRLACERADRVAGIATVGAPLRASLADICPLSRPMPVIQFHGSSDLIVPYAGDGLRPGALEGSRYWAARGGCTEGATERTTLPNRERWDKTQVVKTRYTGCPDSVDVRLYTVIGGGHTWPGSSQVAYTGVLGRTSGDVDATLELWSALIPFSR